MQCDQFIDSSYPTLQHPSSNPGGLPRFSTVGQVQILSGNDGRRPRRRTAYNQQDASWVDRQEASLQYDTSESDSKFSSLKESNGAGNEEGEPVLPDSSTTFSGPLEPLDPSWGPTPANLELLSEDSFRCAYWCRFGIFIGRRQNDTIRVGWK